MTTSTSLTKTTKNTQKGAAGYILGFLLGIPLPVLLVVYLPRQVLIALRAPRPRRDRA